MQNGANREKGALLKSWHTDWHTSGELRHTSGELRHTSGELRHTSGELRLGIGEFQYLGAEVKEARYEFLNCVRKVAPAVLRDLRRLWQSHDTVPAAEIDAWARRYHLIHQGNVPAWVAGVAAATLEAWTRYPAWPADQFDLNGAIASGEMLPNDIEFRWNPHVETRAAAIKRFQMLDVRPGAGEQVVKKLRAAPEHFEWAVRFQIGEEKIADLAGSLNQIDSEERNRKTQKAVLNILRLVQLDKRTNRVGRPRR